MKLGATIKERRLTLFPEKTQGDFAGICEITQTYLSRIENDKVFPNIRLLRLIAGKLNISLPLLLFQSVDEDDLPTQKEKENFKTFMPGIKQMIEGFSAV